MIILASMMVPWQVSLIPNFITVHRLGWLDSYWGLIIPAIPRAFALFFLRQFMLSLPDDLIDAARVDGASELRIWWRIVIPLTIPAMVAMGIFMLVGEWNNLLWPLVIIQSSDLRTLPIVMSQMLGPYSPPLELGRGDGRVLNRIIAYTCPLPALPEAVRPRDCLDWVEGLSDRSAARVAVSPVQGLSATL